MELLNDCPECGKQLSKSRKYCACGWKVPILKETTGLRKCPYMTATGPCDDEGTVSPGREKKWFCSAHWYIAISETYKR